MRWLLILIISVVLNCAYKSNANSALDQALQRRYQDLQQDRLMLKILTDNPGEFVTSVMSDSLKTLFQAIDSLERILFTKKDTLMFDSALVKLYILPLTRILGDTTLMDSTSKKWWRRKN